ncbi:MAG TPA: ATP-binding protein, partial [Verrucomicrobiae bacterium]|nr:ATP-binding protein [Verrucomicrobiae bacterium]
GEERYVRGQGEVVYDAHGRPTQMRGIIMDITERRQLGEQLRQSQKMEAIGQLAGGVAHDFNNILTVIHGHASLLLVDKSVSGNAARSAQQIAQAAERAAGLTRQLLTFSRRQVMQPRRLDLNLLVSNMTMMLGRILGEDIALQLNYWHEPAYIKADASMIEQVLLNLVVNARDAMPKGGQLAIKITTSKADPNYRRYHSDSRAEDFICLNVSDTGCGIDPETLRRIFEPFFTTKEVGKGTGLGLATVYGIVNQHQGWIEVDSEVGKGSSFRVFLPIANESTPADKGKVSPPAARGGHETILVVEDEELVRELVCSVLEGHGYKILQAETGVKALEVWQTHKKKIDLLLTDLVMPDRLNGRELAEKLRAERPKLKVIFTSGYTADVVGKDFISQRGLHYLQKPYDPQKLAAAVRNCLDGKSQ